MMKKILLLSVLNINSISGDNDEKCGGKEWSPAVGVLMIVTTLAVGLNQGAQLIRSFMGNNQKK
jgi:hypothetical protein